MKSEPVFLNLASGTDLRPWPWRNLDLIARWPGTDRGCDIVWDARKDPIPFAESSVDHVYAGYLLLHLQLRYHPFVLSEIRRVLKPGCTAVFGEIDYSILAPRWLANPSDQYLLGLMFGEQGTEHGEALADADKHCTGFVYESLVKTLTDAGLCNPKRVQVHGPAVFYELSVEVTKP